METSRAGLRLGIEAPRQVNVQRINERGEVETNRKTAEIDTSYNSTPMSPNHNQAIGSGE